MQGIEIELLSETSPFLFQCSRFSTAVANAADLLEDMNGSSKLLTGVTTYVRANAKISIFVLKITQGLIKLMQGKFFFDPITAFKVWEQSPKGSYFELALEWIENVNSLKLAGTLALMSSSPIASGMLQLESMKGVLIEKPIEIEALRGLPSFAYEGPLVDQGVAALRRVASMVVTFFGRRSRSMASRFTHR